MSDCVVCNRIPAREVLKYAHIVFQAYPRQQRRMLGLAAIGIINAVDKNNRMFFCGKSKYGLLAGLFYLQGLKLRVTEKYRWHKGAVHSLSQFGIAYVFNNQIIEDARLRRMTTSAVSVHYHRWAELLSRSRQAQDLFDAGVDNSNDGIYE